MTTGNEYLRKLDFLNEKIQPFHFKEFLSKMIGNIHSRCIFKTLSMC